MSEPCGAVVLAAGGGSRFAGATHKLLVDINGLPVLAYVLRAVEESGVSPVIVVTGAIDLSPVLDEARARLKGGLIIVHNERWREGMATSLQCAVHEARERGLAAIVVGLGDQPGIPAAAWRDVAATNAPIAVATYAGVRRNPVRIHAELWDQLPLAGDEGARTLIRIRPELVSEVACEGNADDIDTAEDVLRWQQRSAHRGDC